MALLQISSVRVGRATATVLLAATDRAGDASAVIQDSILSPVEKIVWQVLNLTVSGRSQGVPLPSLAELAGIANVACTETVSESLKVLRASRWLTACQVAGCNGWQRSRACILHESPLAIGDTLRLDPLYPDFLRQAVGRRHARLAALARAALAQLDAGDRSPQ